MVGEKIPVLRVYNALAFPRVKDAATCRPIRKIIITLISLDKMTDTVSKNLSLTTIHKVLFMILRSCVIY